MKRIGILGDIGSGTTYIAKCFGFPVFNADFEVAKIYKYNRKVFQKLKKELPNYFDSFPVKKKDILIFVESKKSEILKRLKKRKNFNMEILNNFKKIQLSLVLKKKKSQFIIKNNFNKNSVKFRVKEIIKNLV